MINKFRNLADAIRSINPVVFIFAAFVATAGTLVGIFFGDVVRFDVALYNHVADFVQWFASQVA